MTVATKVVSQLPGPKGKKKRARYIKKKILENRNRRKIKKKKKNVFIKMRTSDRSSK